MKTRSRTTVSEVALAAGVSAATVSKVLNDRTDVSTATRHAVLRALRESGYTPLGRRRRSIEVLAAGQRLSVYTIPILEGITRAAAELEFDVILGQCLGEESGRVLYPEQLIRSGRSGAILIVPPAGSRDIEILREAEFPVIAVDPHHRSDEDYVSVGATNFTGGVSATKHLLALGHRRIAHASGLVKSDCNQARFAGYSSALRQAGIELDESLITHSVAYYQAVSAAAEKLLDRDDRPTAVFAGNDEIALGLMVEARRRGIAVPDEFSVVGFDDTLFAARAEPALTTVAQPLVDMGATAVQSLHQLLNHRSMNSRRIELETRLIIRDSTAPPLMDTK